MLTKDIFKELLYHLVSQLLHTAQYTRNKAGVANLLKKWVKDSKHGQNIFADKN
jgi:hypothetical protein